jgi:tRNA-2-methylthio-N6-dimethylallyladenosine synthase
LANKKLMQDLATKKEIDEVRQGERFAPFILEPNGYKMHFYIESYGCQMNFADSEVVASILYKGGYGATQKMEDADLIFINTCSIREKAEQTVRKRLADFKKLKKQKPGLLVGVLGCMAERLKSKFLEEEKLVDIVVGPDAYRSLPQLVAEANHGQKSVNVLLSREETYADISPVRLNSNGVAAFVSIMRGCNNMCSFCVVPFTRGRERSRDAQSIVNECKDLFNNGYREVTLLGQNVDSYNASTASSEGEESQTHDANASNDTNISEVLIESEISALESGRVITFANLLELVAQISPELRVRFSTSHPKDITDEVLHTMAAYENICKCIHLPVQSGSTRVLHLMNRTYTREWYKNKIDLIRKILPDCSITSDIIAGFCTEEESDHLETLSIMDYSRYDFSYMFVYSERPGTLAQKKYADDIPLDVKKRRLQEIIEKQNVLSLENYKKDVGKTFKVLIDGDSKRSSDHWVGRTSQNKVVIFPKKENKNKKGNYVQVMINDCTQATLFGTIED